MRGDVPTGGNRPPMKPHLGKEPYLELLKIFCELPAAVRSYQSAIRQFRAEFSGPKMPSARTCEMWLSNGVLIDGLETCARPAFQILYDIEAGDFKLSDLGCPADGLMKLAERSTSAALKKIEAYFASDEFDTALRRDLAKQTALVGKVADIMRKSGGKAGLPDVESMSDADFTDWLIRGFNTHPKVFQDFKLNAQAEVK